MAKYLDYEGLKTYDSNLKNYLTDIIGTDYKISDRKVNVKEYIDSRIFVGTEADIELARATGRIDESALTFLTDDETQLVVSISDNEINKLF